MKINKDIVVIILTVVTLFVIGYFFNLDYIRILVSRFGFWGPVIVILAKALTIIIAPLSGSPIYLLAGAFYGFPSGLIYVAIGDFIGYTTAFYIARILGRQFVDRFISQNKQSLFSRIIIHLGTLKGFIQSCFIFFAMPELLSYGTGLTRLAYWKFISILFSGSVIITGIIVLAGDYFGQMKDYHWWLTVFPLIGFVMVVLGSWFFAKNVKEI